MTNTQLYIDECIKNMHEKEEYHCKSNETYNF